MTKVEWSHFREPAAPLSLPWMVGFDYYGLLFGCVTAVAGTTEHWKTGHLFLLTDTEANVKLPS